MSDPRITKLAQVLIHYSLKIKPGQKLQISTSPLGVELALAAYIEALKAGANTHVDLELPDASEAFFRLASDAQLDFINPVRRLITETFDASLTIDAEYNTRNLSGIDPSRIARRGKANAFLSKIFLERSAKGELKWCLTLYPTQSTAQEADMSLSDYQEFVYNAGMLDEPDPVEAWRQEYNRQKVITQWLNGKDKVLLKGSDIDLSFSIKDRLFIECAGEYNFPDGEIFTGPVEDSANGWVRFQYPGIYSGKEVTDIELWFENGKVVKEKASKGQELLTALLNTDEGARYLGEWGIGTNYHIQRFTKNMLFDEKIGGTLHLALGAGYPESHSKNDSGIHWDMLCDMNASEILVDGELFYKDGKVAI